MKKLIIELFRSKAGEIHHDSEECAFCGLCQKKCRAKAIIVNRQKKEWKYIRGNCFRCKRCVKKCPKNSLSLVRREI